MCHDDNSKVLQSDCIFINSTKLHDLEVKLIDYILSVSEPFLHHMLFTSMSYPLFVSFFALLLVSHV